MTGIASRLAVGVFALLFGAACASEPPASEPVARGAQVFRSVGCGGCHESHFGLPAEAPDLEHVGAVARSGRQDEDAARFVRETALRMPGGRAKRLPQGDLEALVQYLLSRR